MLWRRKLVACDADTADAAHETQSVCIKFYSFQQLTYFNQCLSQPFLQWMGNSLKSTVGILEYWLDIHLELDWMATFSSCFLVLFAQSRFRLIVIDVGVMEVVSVKDYSCKRKTGSTQLERTWTFVLGEISLETELCYSALLKVRS